MGPGGHHRRFTGKVLLGVMAFMLVDLLIFRSGFYFGWTDPNSSLGVLARAIVNVDHASKTDRNVLVLGDSRIGEGFSAKSASAVAAATGRGIAFINGGVAGTTPRVWYYLLRAMLQSGQLPAAVAIMTTSYHDNDSSDLPARTSDIMFVHPLLQPRDLVTFPASFPSVDGQIAAARAILLSGYHYKSDLADLLLHPARRIETVRSWRANGFDWVNDYSGHNTSLEGLQLDLPSGRLSIPPQVQDVEPLRLAAYAAKLRQFSGRPPDDPSSRGYRSLWYGRIGALCRAKGIALFVFRIPRGPLHFMAHGDGEATGGLADLRDGGRLRLLPATQFDDLERPEFFFDELHLNAAGRVQFSRSLTTAMLNRLP